MKKLILCFILTITLFIPSTNASSNFLEELENNPEILAKIKKIILQESQSLIDTSTEELNTLLMLQRTDVSHDPNSEAAKALLAKIAELQGSIETHKALIEYLTPQAPSIEEEPQTSPSKGLDDESAYGNNSAASEGPEQGADDSRFSPPHRNSPSTEVLRSPVTPSSPHKLPVPYAVQAPKGFTVQDTRLSPKKLEELKNAIRNPTPIPPRESHKLETEAAEPK